MPVQLIERVFTMPRSEEITPDVVATAIKLHSTQLLPKYNELYDMYKGDHPILKAAAKAAFKPDNRLVVNFAKYIVDTLNGYFMGKPIKITHKSDSDINEYVTKFVSSRDDDDNNAELSKMTSIYGHAFKVLYQDTAAVTRVTYNNPKTMFVVYDDTIQQDPYFAVLYGVDSTSKVGTVYTATHIMPFILGDKVTFQDSTPHLFGDVPIIEFIENEERQGAFENVITLINAFNKAFSEKGNDVDYFADAYLKVLGVELTDAQLKTLRDSRIINLFGEDLTGQTNPIEIIVEFLEKPNADTTQENFITRLERLIYQMSMVSNINDKDFGNASGVSLAYKLQSMENLALMKERKITSGLKKQYKMLFAIPGNVQSSKQDSWIDLDFKFTRNIPLNTKDEAETAGALSGITSRRKQLETLSVVADVDAELEQIAAEKESGDYSSLGGV